MAPVFILRHRHDPAKCACAYAAWKGFSSPLRRHRTLSSCVDGGHEIWWRVPARSPAEALALLPPYVAERTEAIETREVRIP
jgi:hypothetical protein